MAADSSLCITLVVAPKGCPKCTKCEDLLRDLARERPGQFTWAKLPADAPEAEDYGVVMPPMIVVGDFIACAGRVPTRDSLARLIDTMLQEANR